MSRSKVIDMLARVAAKRGHGGMAGHLCEYRDRLAAAEKMAEEAEDWFQTFVVDRMSPGMKERYLSEMASHLERMKARLEAMRAETDPEKIPSEAHLDALLSNMEVLEKALSRYGG